MNLFKVISKIDWVADRSVLLRLYCSFVCSRLEYGCAVFSSMHKSYLKKLEPIQNFQDFCNAKLACTSDLPLYLMG